MIDSRILLNKKILLFSQFFFGYENKIAEKMREFGAEVSLYDEMSVTKTIERAFLKISPRFFSVKTERYYFEILEKEKEKSYDYVLFIDCEMPTIKILKAYKKVFQNARFCLYMWDSLDNLIGVKEKIKYFDFVSTFDRKDAKDCKIGFRPLFYADEYRGNNELELYDYDLTFIGTIHSDRYAIIKNLMETTRKMFVYPFLQSRFIYYFYKITKTEFRNTHIDDFKFNKIDSKTLAKLVRGSRVVLDIQHPRQTGLTMRTIEMIGMKKKMVTTNEDIVNYDFYCEDNICIINRNNPVIPDVFFKTKYKEIPENVYEYYSIGQWILGVLGESDG